MANPAHPVTAAGGTPKPEPRPQPGPGPEPGDVPGPMPDPDPMPIPEHDPELPEPGEVTPPVRMNDDCGGGSERY